MEARSCGDLRIIGLERKTPSCSTISNRKDANAAHADVLIDGCCEPIVDLSRGVVMLVIMEDVEGVESDVTTLQIYRI